MAKVAILSYIDRKSIVHVLTGTTKLVFFLAWSVAAMVTYDTRVLLCMFVGSLIIFRISKVKYRDVSVVLGLAAVFLLLNNLFVYLFSPEYGVELYESRTLLFTIAGRYTITVQQLFYHFAGIDFFIVFSRSNNSDSDICGPNDNDRRQRNYNVNPN